MRLTARQLNQATLARQLLLRREAVDVVEAVRRVVALQAQEPASPYVALWNRVDGFDPAELDVAFASQAIVKAQLMRITLHAVMAGDYPPFHEAMQHTLRAARLHDRRFKNEGVSIPDTDALVPDLLEFTSSPRVNREVEAWLEARFGTPKPRVWWALRQCGPFVHAATGGPWSFGSKPSYVGAIDQARPRDVAASTRALIVRYLEGFGPASLRDIAQFGTIYRPPVKAALTALGDALVHYDGPNGERLYDVPGGPLPPEDMPAPPRLLPMWDSTLLAYADRSRIIPPAFRSLVMRRNGDVLPTILVDGHVAGVWRPTDAGIEVTAFRALDDNALAGLETEARSLRAFVAGREPVIFQGRFAHWWSELPTDGVEVHLLGG
ncbi:MAG: winged helix DNA-binding domain-containing protein [Chloroflexi bacterium]|nr:winged helix DNA-binding domain-containing protein [Chloroflexota bacterium]